MKHSDQNTEEVEKYFNGSGFTRWNKIYSQSDNLNFVQKRIRLGHSRTLDYVLGFLSTIEQPERYHLSDIGCGVGSCFIPAAEMGFKDIFASDISKKMVDEAQKRFATSGAANTHVTYQVGGLEDIDSSADIVICLDVFIHYPQEKAEEMVKKLSTLARKYLIISFAPYALHYYWLKKIGSLFPGPSKTTRAFLLKEQPIVDLLMDNGFIKVESKLNKAPFYFSKTFIFKKDD